ncbi:MAG: hypothetical protein ACK5EU_17965 [Pseudanabaena sp.]|nr:hypothetical protein [Pseudanabaena sp. CoA8_M7]
MIAWYVVTVLGVTAKVRFLCQYETRIGLNISDRKITARGVKPKATVFKYFLTLYQSNLRTA